jgi:hypothetical protein
MKLISRKRTGGTPLRDATAKWIADNIIRVQLSAARMLRHLERKCTLSQKKALFLTFCVLSIASLLYILAGVFIDNNRKPAPVPVTITDGLPPVIPPPLPPALKDSLTSNEHKY